MRADNLRKFRQSFFSEIAGTRKDYSVEFVVITHILIDRVELLRSLEHFGEVSQVIAVPYSVQESAKKRSLRFGI